MIDDLIKILVVLLASTLLLFLMMALANKASAQGRGVSSPIQAGEVSPCTGILFPQMWTLQAVQCIDVDLPLWNEKESLCSSLSLAKGESWSRKESSYKSQIKDLENLTRKTPLEGARWYQSRVLWFSVGLVTGGALILVVK